tara:strand:+ start:6587 stop:7540 length:954 start_codon:yes stop_codon:yes gene_type:complete
MRADADDKPTSKSMVDASVDKRYAAVADQSYADNREKSYPSLKDATLDRDLTDERNIVYHDKDGSTWWGIRGTDFSSPKDLSTDASIVGEHVLENRFAKLTKLFSIPSGKLSAADVAKDVIGTYRKERFANVEKKFEQIRKKYKTGIIHIGGHSLAGALSQHLLKSLSKKKEQRVRVHVFNALPLHGFDPRKHTASYHETRNALDPISMHAKGPNLRITQDYKPGDKITGNEPIHAMDQFVGVDLSKYVRGHESSTYENLNTQVRGDSAARDRVANIKKIHTKIREQIRKKFIKGLKLKAEPSLRTTLERKRRKDEL